MLSVPDGVIEVLRSHQSGRTYGIASYQGATVEIQVDAKGSVSFVGDAVVQAATSIHVMGGSESLVPKTRTDFLAPYGQEVSLFREVLTRSGSVAAVIPLGVYRITSNSGARETVRVTPGTVVDNVDGFFEVEPGLWAVNVYHAENPAGSGLYEVGDLVESPPGSGLYLFDTVSASEIAPLTVLDWELDVELSDRFHMLERGKLIDPKSPVIGNSMYDEIRRLSLIPVVESLPDRSVPRATVYEDRISAIRTLAELAGGVPHMTREGALTLRVKDAWLTDVDPVFDISGTIEWSDGQSDEFYNYVKASSPDGKYSAYALEDDDSNPLSVGRAGPSTYEYSSPVITNPQAAQSAANTVLRRLMYRRSREVTVSCTPDALLLELGDVGWMRDPIQRRSVLGEVSGIRVSLDPTEPVQVNLIVAEAA